MARILVVYHSRAGNTRKMAEHVCAGARKAGSECDIKSAEETDADRLKDYEGIILGSPTYYGHPAAEMKKLIDASVKFHGQLTGKVGGAFASCGVLGGGAETTVLALIDALLIHGMIVQGTTKGAHYGPISVGAPNDKVASECEQLGQRVAELARKLFP